MPPLPALVKQWSEKEPPSETDIRSRLEAEGLLYYRWANAAGDVYAAHTHPFYKVIYVVQGSITFGLPGTGEQLLLTVGDRLELPPSTIHEAIVGSQGVVCLEAHRSD